MTCPFYVCDGRPSCLIGEPDGRHCGPRQYPVCVCNLDEIGRGEAWRGTVMQHVEAFEFYSWLEIPYGGSLQTDFKTHGDVCRSCEYGIDYKGRSFCCKPCYWVGGRTHGVRDCSAYVRSGVGWSP